MDPSDVLRMRKQHPSWETLPHPVQKIIEGSYLDTSPDPEVVQAEVEYAYQGTSLGFECFDHVPVFTVGSEIELNGFTVLVVEVEGDFPDEPGRRPFISVDVALKEES